MEREEEFQNFLSVCIQHSWCLRIMPICVDEYDCGGADT